MNKFKTYEEYSNTPVSEKITLATVNCKQRIYGFTQVESSDIYSVVTDLFVAGCQKGLTSLEAVSSSGEVTASSYYYDIVSSTLYVQSASGFTGSASDPEIIPTYRLFFSNIPINLSCDFKNNSEQVLWDARIVDSPAFTTKIDTDQTGISVTGSGNLKLNNSDFFFKDYYELFYFENQEVSIYSYNRELDPDQAQIIYRGIITDKSYGNKYVTLKIKDDITKLGESIPLGKYSEIADSINVTESVSQYVKRRIYGVVNDLKVQSVDMLYDEVLDEEAYTLSSNVTLELNSTVCTGSNFLKEVSVNDKIFISGDEYTVDKIQSDTRLVLSEEALRSYTGAAKVSPEKSWYNTNRVFLICGHDLDDINTTVTKVIERNRVEVSSTTYFKVGDSVNIGDQHLLIKRISGNKFIFSQNINDPYVGLVIYKDKIQNARIFYPDTKTFITLEKTDYTISSTADATYVTLTDDAEKNATIAKNLSGNYYAIKGFDVFWLGVPTIFRLDCPANVSGSLYGKYFSVYSDQIETIFWFSENLESDTEEEELLPPAAVISIPASSINVSSNEITYNSHGLLNGQNISFTNTEGSLPGGITSGYNYYVREATTNTFKISADATGNIKDITSQGSGTNSATIEKNVYKIVLPADNMTAAEVALEVAYAISENSETYLTYTETEKAILYSKKGISIQQGSVGTSGITYYKLMTGRPSDQSIDLTSKLSTRDYVKTASSSDLEYYEVSEVYADSFRIRSKFIGDSGSYGLFVKNVNYVDNDSNLYISTTGKVDSNGEQIVNSSDIVKDLLIEAGLTSRLDLTSFAKSKLSIPYELSLKLPVDLSSDAPDLKEVIDSINSTVIASLVLTKDLKIAYNCVDTSRDSQMLPTINDDDIFEWSLKSTSQNYKRIQSKYNFTDLELLPYSEYIYESEFAKKYTDSLLTLEIDLFLHDHKDVAEASQRRLYLSTLSVTDISIQGGLNLGFLEMNDKVILCLMGMYCRQGDSDSNKIIGTVTSIKKDGETVELTVTIIGGGIFNRSSVITDDSRDAFATATEDGKLYSSFITGEDGTISNKNDLQGCNSVA